MDRHKPKVDKYLAILQGIWNFVEVSKKAKKLDASLITLCHTIGNSFSHLICNLVLEKCFCKLGFFFLVREKWLTRKKVGLYYKSPFLSGWKSGSANSIFFSGSRKLVDQKKNPS